MKTINTLRLAVMVSVFALTTHVQAYIVTPGGNSDTLRYNRDNTCQIVIKHRGGMDFGNTFIAGEPRTVYFTAYPSLGKFTGDFCIGMFELTTHKIVAWSDTRTVNIKVWDGFYLPFKADVPAGRYYIRLLARSNGGEWSMCKITDYKAWYDADPATTEYYEGPELYEYTVLPFESKQPSLDYLKYYSTSTIYNYELDKEYQMPYRMFNRLSEPLAGTIRLVYERNEIDSWGSWFDVIGEKEISIAANAWKVDSLSMKASIDRGDAQKFVATIRMYWQEQNSSEWVLLTNLYNGGKTPEGYELNVDGVWVNINHVYAKVVTPTSIEEETVSEVKVRFASGTLHLTGITADQVDLINLSGQVVVSIKQPQESNPVSVANGIYIARITTDKGAITTRKIAVKN